jgi:tetratricopeptide (TPR) repeat protein
VPRPSARDSRPITTKLCLFANPGARKLRVTNLKRTPLVARVAALQVCAIQHRDQGRYLAAKTCLHKGLAQLGPAAGATPIHLALWNELGMVYKYLGKFQTALKFYQLALRHSNKCLTGSERDHFLANLYHNLGGLEHSRRRFLQGERYSRKSLRLRLRAAGPGSLALAADRVALAANLDGLRKFSESQNLYRQALRVYRRVYGPSHREIALVLNNLAAVYQATARSNQAVKYYRTALEMKRRELGSAHPDLGITINNLGILCESAGRKRYAKLYFTQALKLFEASLGRSHPHTRAVRNNLKKMNSSKVATLPTLDKRVRYTLG